MSPDHERKSLEECIRSIVAQVNRQMDDRFAAEALTEIASPGFKDEVGDSPAKYYLPGILTEHDAVLLVSNRAFPDAVERAVENAKRARSMLTGAAAAVIPVPFASGRWNNLSYAVWPEFRALSRTRWLRGLQKKLLISPVCRWLRAVATQTTSPLSNEHQAATHCRRPLEAVAGNLALPHPVRDGADQGLRLLDRGELRLVTVLQHSDFWQGNILLCRNRLPGLARRFGFGVIDWGGAKFDGSPYFDLIRYCMSSSMGLARARRQLQAYAKALGSVPGEASLYVTAALGRIGMDLEEFPVERYVGLCTRSIRFLADTRFAR